MNHPQTILATAVRRALIAGTVISGAGFHYSASAQQEAAGTLEEVVITGSRLRRDRDFVEVSPVQTIDFEQIQSSGNVTLEDTLNKFPQLAPDSTSTTNQSGGSGALTANLRGLGAERTLVLVDGRRFMPADVTGVADLATIPDILIERVEIVTGGASAVYGSDAIAGAVNFILRKDFEGAEVRYQYGEADAGDGETEKVDVLFGANVADGRGNVVLHASYTEREPVFMGDRSFSEQPFLADSNGVLQPFGSGNIPEGLIGLSSSQFSQIQGVDLAGANCPGPVQGVRFGENSQPLPFCRPTDQFNYAAPNFLLRPLKRWQISSLGSFQINDKVEAYGQAYYTRKENAFQQAPESTSPTSAGQENGTVLIPGADTNPLFSQPLQDFFALNRDFFDADGDGVFTVRNLGRRFEEFGPRTVSYKTEALSLTGGLRGTFELNDSTWGWDAFYQYSRVDEDVTRAGLLSRSRITLGLDTVIVDGESRCRNDLLNCVPVNIFGPNALTPEMADFLSVSTGQRDQFTRQVAGASIAGDLFELPAGKVSSAFGLEYRKEDFSTVPDETALSGDLVAVQVAPIVNGGEYDIVEAFAEVRVPLLEDMPAVQSLALEGAARFADYSTIGSVTAWSASLDWEITDELRARAGLSTAIRAPNLNELFSAQAGGFTGGVDPCLAVRNPSAQQKELCLQQGVPQANIDSLEVGASQGFDVISGGNPDLEEETSDTLTAGLVYMPTALQGLSVSLDYYEIEVEDAIAQVSGQALVDSCFRTLDAGSAACQSIDRLSSGNINRVSAPLLNVATRRVEGMDLQLNYAMDNLPEFMSLPGQGATLDITFVTSWQFANETQVLAGEPTIDCAGFYGGTCSSDGVRIDPDVRSLVRANWRSGPLRITPELRYIGELELAEDAFANENGTLDPEYYVDLTAGYDVSDSIQVYAGINNVFDRSPPVLGFRAGGDANTNVQLFDPIGRRFFIGFNVGFGPR